MDYIACALDRYILCVWSARLLLCSFVAVIAFRQEHNTRYHDKKQIKRIWKYRKLLHNIEYIYNACAYHSGKREKQKKTKKRQKGQAKKEKKRTQSGRNKNWQHSARGRVSLTEAESREHKNCSPVFDAELQAIGKGEACARVRRAGDDAQRIYTLYIIIWLYIILWREAELEAIEQMHYMYDERARHETGQRTRARQANARAKQGKRPSPTGVFAKTLGGWRKRAHPPPWEENCVMSCFGSASPDWVFLTFYFTIFSYFLLPIAWWAEKNYTRWKIFRPEAHLLDDLWKNLYPTKIFRPRGCWKNLRRKKIFRPSAGRDVWVYVAK